MKIEKECHITALVMVKNESLTIERTLDSLFNDDATCKVDRIAIFDTGSTDDTLEKCKTYANKTTWSPKKTSSLIFPCPETNQGTGLNRWTQIGSSFWTRTTNSEMQTACESSWMKRRPK